GCHPRATGVDNQPRRSFGGYDLSPRQHKVGRFCGVLRARTRAVLCESGSPSASFVCHGNPFEYLSAPTRTGGRECVRVVFSFSGSRSLPESRRSGCRINAAIRSRNQTSRAHERTTRSVAAFADTSVATLSTGLAENCLNVFVAQETNYTKIVSTVRYDHEFIPFPNRKAQGSNHEAGLLLHAQRLRQGAHSDKSP